MHLLGDNGIAEKWPLRPLLSLKDEDIICYYVSLSGQVGMRPVLGACDIACFFR